MENKTLNIIVGQSFHKSRLDKFLHESGSVHSRSRAAQLIDLNLVSVNGAIIKKSSHKVLEGDRVQVVVPQLSTDVEIQPLKMDLDIVFEDSDLLVINKPAGLVVHPAAGHSQDTLVNALVHHVKDLSMGFGENRPGIVHRLDKDTSGLLVVAKNDLAQENLAKQFKEKTVHRVYKALVYGELSKKSGTFESYLIRHPVNRKKFCSEKIHEGVTPKGKRAVTHFSVEKVYPSGISLVSCQLETGRTHQIRIHMFESHHGIIGDPIYDSSGRIKSLKSTRLRGLIKNLPRIALHAEQLGFNHPKTGEKLMFKTDWPEDMNDMFQFLNRKD